MTTPTSGSEPDLIRALAHLEHGDWRAAHDIVQQDEASPLSCWAHGIVHLMEGDKANARYWYGQAGRPFRDDPPAEVQAFREALIGL
jgi:hypothetical protein